MPWYAGVRSIVYRTDVFEKAGVTPPTSWDELVAAGEKLEDANPDMITFPVPGDSEYGVYPFVWGAGGEIAEQEGDSWASTIDSPEAQEGITFYTDLAKEHGFSSPAATTWDEADLSDDHFDAPEAPGLDVICRGLSMVADDDTVLEVATAVFDGLYEYRRRALLLGRDPA